MENCNLKAQQNYQKNHKKINYSLLPSKYRNLENTLVEFIGTECKKENDDFDRIQKKVSKYENKNIKSLTKKHKQELLQELLKLDNDKTVQSGGKRKTQHKRKRKSSTRK